MESPMKNYSDKEVKKASESHASNMPDFGIGKKTPDAMLKDWSQNTYVMKQDGNGSMNYMEEKRMIAKKDAARMSRTMAKVGDAV